MFRRNKRARLLPNMDRDHKVITKLVDNGKLREGSVLACILKDDIYGTGIATREGIKCLCQSCGGNGIFAVSAFEAHVGSNEKRPSKMIFLHDDQYGGYRKTLEMLNNQPKSADTTEFGSSRNLGESSKQTGQMLASIAQSSKNSGQSARSSTISTCDFCSGTGDVVFCSTQDCPAAFHVSCSVRVTRLLANGRWYCQECSCSECQSPLCEKTTFSSVIQGTFPNHYQWNALVNCYQCGDTYHKECLMQRGNYPISFQTFCCTYCEQMSEILGELLQYVLHPGGRPLPVFLAKWNEELFLSFLFEPEPDIDTLHSLGKVKAIYAHKLFYAMKILRDCFPHENRVFQKILYNRRSTERDLGHNGFFVVFIEEGKELTRGKKIKLIHEVIAVATIRIHSQKVAEMPFIGTSTNRRGQGFFSKLMSGLDQMLRQLGVLKWVVHSPPEFVKMWAAKYSFYSINISDMRSLLESNLLKVGGTTLLCKNI